MIIAQNDSMLIRYYHEDDTDELYHAVLESQKELMRYFFWCHTGYSRMDSAEWIKAQCSVAEPFPEHNYGVFDKTTGGYLGGVAINRIDFINRCCWLGYWTRSGSTGKGIATDAARLMVEHAFWEHDINRVEIVMRTDNSASIRVAEKLGAVREGIMRGRIALHGEYYDAFLYALIRDEYKGKRDSSG